MSVHSCRVSFFRLLVGQVSPGVSKGRSLSVLHRINPIPDGGIVVPNQGDETVMKSLFVVVSHKFLKNSVSLVPSFNITGLLMSFLW